MYKARARSGVLTGAAVTIDAIGLAHLIDNRSPVAMAAGSHPFPSRTRKLSPPAPMVLGGRPPGRVGRRRISNDEDPRSGGGPSSFWPGTFWPGGTVPGMAGSDPPRSPRPKKR